MRKFEIEHLSNRIEEVVLCTNGTVSTQLSKQKKDLGCGRTEKYNMIKTGKATLLPIADISQIETDYGRRPVLDEIFGGFEFPLTAQQKKNKAFNERIDRKIDEIHTEIELEGKRLLDRALLGVIDAAAIPDELKSLGALAALANK